MPTPSAQLRNRQDCLRQSRRYCQLQRLKMILAHDGVVVPGTLCRPTANHTGQGILEFDDADHGRTIAHAHTYRVSSKSGTARANEILSIHELFLYQFIAGTAVVVVYYCETIGTGGFGHCPAAAAEHYLPDGHAFPNPVQVRPGVKRRSRHAARLGRHSLHTCSRLGWALRYSGLIEQPISSCTLCWDCPFQEFLLAR